LRIYEELGLAVQLLPGAVRIISWGQVDLDKAHEFTVVCFEETPLLRAYIPPGLVGPRSRYLILIQKLKNVYKPSPGYEVP